MSERDLILTWVREHGRQQCWTLDLFRHLTDSGVPPRAAIEAMEQFVEDVITIKAAQIARRQPLFPTDD
jgi:hypothetical protein